LIRTEPPSLKKSRRLRSSPGPAIRCDMTSFDIHEIRLSAKVLQPALMVLSEI
jgi:hypothetical protein